MTGIEKFFYASGVIGWFIAIVVLAAAIAYCLTEEATKGGRKP